MKTVPVLVFVLTLCVRLVNGRFNGSSSRWLEAKARLKSAILLQDSVRWKMCPNATTSLYFSFRVYEVIACDEVEQTFSTVNLLVLSWPDPGLEWDPLEFEGIDRVTLSYDDLWHPRIAVTNAADQEFAIIHALNNQVQVTHKGVVNITTSVFLRTTCSMDLTWYPFDQQNCQIMFLPFLDDCQFEVSASIFDNLPNPFQLRGEWEILRQNITPLLYETQYTKGYTAAGVDLIVTRASLFYVITFIAPMLLTSLMTSFVFLIPPDSGEKFSFLVSIFVSNAVFLNFIAGTLPRAMTLDNIPRLTLLLIGVMVHSFLALLATLFVVRKYKSKQSPEEECSPADQTKNQHPSSEKSSNAQENPKVLSDVPNSQIVTTPFTNVLQTDKTRRFGELNYKRWDSLFFVLFNVASISFYCILVAIPSQAKPSWSNSV